MKIEQEPLQIAKINLEQIKFSGSLMGLSPSRSLKLEPQQMEMLQLMTRSLSIEEIIQHFLQKQILISFSSLRDLLRFMVQEKILLNSEFQDYFSEEPPSKETSFFQDLVQRFGGTGESPINVQEEMAKIPFFRSLDKNLFDIFLTHKNIVQVPPQISVCLQGQQQRSLFAILKGEAVVYKKNKTGQRHKVATLSQGSVFGETGFFLGEPRTADVVTSQDSVIARYKYLPETFDHVIKTETARVLQKRFWLIHALLKSEMFSCLPEDCFDSLLFAGEFKTLPADQIVCQEGDRGDACYLVVQGNLVVGRKGKSIRVLGQGDCFGEIALILNQGLRTATVRTQTEVILLEISSKKFYDLLSQNLWLACEFESWALSLWNKDKQRSSQL